jgi:outer membrane autotransporter protein
LAAQGSAAPSAFSAFSFGQSRYETGSHVNVNSFSLLIGAAYGFDTGAADVTIGAFFEYGNGGYDSHNSFATGNVDGDGDVDYVGGGLLARVDFAKSDAGSTYVDLSGHFGSSTNEYSTSNFSVGIPVVKFDYSSNYFGLNIGVGHVFNINDTTSLDLYAKYLWTHQDGHDIDEYQLHFDDVDSQRIRAGVRVAIQANEWVKPYFGAAFEQEFDGEAKATVNGYATDVPELKGSTGIGEIGLSVFTGTPANLDFGVQGYIGQRKGVSGHVMLNFKF